MIPYVHNFPHTVYVDTIIIEFVIISACFTQLWCYVSS
jgi:hypothetical protein